MESLIGLRGLGLAFVLLVVSTGAQGETRLNTEAIDKAMGVAGQVQGDVYKISLPRTDLSISIDQVKLKARFALGSWIAFKVSEKATVAHGDLVLIEDEVGQVLQKFEQDGITLTALHNHVIRESPKVMYLHFWAEGDAGQLAMKLRRALSVTKTPFGKPDMVQNIQSHSPTGEELPAERIQGVLGQKGTVKDGVLSVTVPHPGTIRMRDVDLPSSMGMATAINVQAGAVGKVAATGDFVLSAKEVSAVASALTRHDIQVTALHNHLVHSSPDLYFMHFWAHDSPDRVAQGLKAGLDAMTGSP
jgi:hypothetical protein